MNTDQQLIARMIEAMKLWGVKAPVLLEAEKYIKDIQEAEQDDYFLNALDNERMNKADEAFCDADLPEMESAGAWNVDGDIWSCQVYWTSDDPNEDSVLGSFTVEFAIRSAKIVATNWQ